MALSKRANRKEETESWGDRQADMRCDAPCRSPWEKGAPQNATNVSVCINASDTGEACRTCGPLAAPKWEIPSKAVQSSHFRKSHLCISLDFWVVRLLIPHMHTFTVQGFSVCNQHLCLRLRVGGQTCLDLGGDRPQVTRKLLLQSVVSHCRFFQMWEVFDGLSVTRKSHLQNEKNNNKKNIKARDGKRSAMYRLNCPVKTKTTVV